MKTIYSIYAHPDKWRFAIVDEGDLGFFLYVYEIPEFFDEDMQNGDYDCPGHQQDHSQDTPEQAKRQAFEYFGVPIDSWREIEAG